MLKDGMRFKVNFGLCLIIIFLTSCTTQNISPATVYVKEIPKNDIPGGAYIFEPPKQTAVPINNTQPSFKGDYKDISFIHFIGFNESRKQEILNGFYELNSSYFQNLHELEFIYSNKEQNKIGGGAWETAGLYTPYKIQIWVFDEPVSQIKYWLLHDVKHEYCWTNYQVINEKMGWQLVNGQTYWTHDGCFLNTPIDKEYGFVE